MNQNFFLFFWGGGIVFHHQGSIFLQWATWEYCLGKGGLRSLSASSLYYGHTIECFRVLLIIYSVFWWRYWMFQVTPHYLICILVTLLNVSEYPSWFILSCGHTIECFRLLLIIYSVFWSYYWMFQSTPYYLFCIPVTLLNVSGYSSLLRMQWIVSHVVIDLYWLHVWEHCPCNPCICMSLYIYMSLYLHVRVYLHHMMLILQVFVREVFHLISEQDQDDTVTATALKSKCAVCIHGDK